MNKKTLFIFLIVLFVFSALAVVVSAAPPQQQPNIISSVLGPFGSRIHTVYRKFDVLIDAAIYLVIFLGLAQATIGRKFEYKKGGRAITIGIGIVLAFGLALFGCA